MQLRQKAPLIVVAAAAAIFAGGNLVCYRSQLAFIDKCKKQQLQDVATEIKTGLVSQSKQAASFAELVAEMPAVQEALRAGDRERIVRELGPSFTLVKKKYGAEQGIFALSDLTTFLRLHQPEHFGDDLSKREIIVRANHENATQMGAEIGATGLSIRGVAPVNDAKGHIGTFSWGLAFERLLRRVNENTGAELGVFVDAHFLPRSATAPVGSQSAALAEEGNGLQTFRTVDTTDRARMKQLVNEELISNVREVTYSSKKIPEEWGLVAVPLVDFGNRQVGVIVGAKDLSEFHHDSKSLIVTYGMSLVIGLVLLAGVVQVVFGGLILRPLVDLGEKLDKLAGGDIGHKSDLGKRQDEVGAVARHIERLRERIAADKVDAKPADAPAKA